MKGGLSMKNNTIIKFFKEKVIPIFTSIDWSNVKPATYVRYILAIVATINTVLIMLNIHPINLDENKLYEVVSIIINIIVMLVNTYKDNPTSKEAILANNIMKGLKAMDETREETFLGKVNDIITEINASEPIQKDEFDEKSNVDTVDEEETSDTKENE